MTKFVSAKVRNIGRGQLSTDNAAYVVKQICKGKKLGDIKFVNEVNPDRIKHKGNHKSY